MLIATGREAVWQYAAFTCTARTVVSSQDPIQPIPRAFTASSISLSRLFIGVSSGSRRASFASLAAASKELLSPHL